MVSNHRKAPGPGDPFSSLKDKTKKPLRPPGVDDHAILRVYPVPREATGMRLDVFMRQRLRNTSRTRARLIVENCAYTLEGRALKASDRVRAGQSIALWRPAFDEVDEPVQVPAIYEDEHLLVVDKPPLMAVHPTARHHHATVLKCLEAERGGQALWLIHRLDRETSGLLLLAKTKTADRAFKIMLEDRTRALIDQEGSERFFEKEYLALTSGAPPEGRIDLPLESDPESSLRVKMRPAVPKTGLSASTEIKLLGERQGTCLCRCRLLTGRQHQIRVHLSAVGTPIVGDKLYGKDPNLLARAADNALTDQDRAELVLPRHALHAHCYRLRHAITEEELELCSPMPKDLEEFWASLAIDGEPSKG